MLMNSPSLPLTIELVICTYNNATQLNHVLAAIAQQQVSETIEWGVLVVNNNCTDGTMALVEQAIAAGKIPHLRVVQETTQGLTPARLCGVQNTTAQWIAFVDDDCVLKPNWVEQAVHFAAHHPDCGAFGGRVVLTWETPPPPFVLRYGYSFAEQEHGFQVQERDCLVGAGMVVNRQALITCGWIKHQLMPDRIGTKLISGGDVELALRLRGTGYALCYTPACELQHLIPPRRTSEAYLKSMNFSLGTCQMHADLMLWAGSFSGWIQAAVQKTTQSSLQILIQTLRAALGKVEAVDVAIQWSFVQGQWVGIIQLLQSDRDRQQALLGCAKVC